MYPQPQTEADQGEFFLIVQDQLRNVFSIEGLVTDDLQLARKINAANLTDGSAYRWKVAGGRDGPRYGAGALREAQAAMPNGTFVRDAMAETVEPVKVADQPPFGNNKNV